MYYSNGNYEAFARPRKPVGADAKSAYLVGGGLASLAAAAFLVRDGQVAGDRITILEATDTDGGALDGAGDARNGWLMRGGREMENHFECLWDLFRSIPSLEVPDASVLDEFYWLNKDDPNYSLMRATQNRGQDGGTDGKFTLTKKAQRELMKLVFAKESDLEDKKITDVLGKDFLASNFWLYWRTMFAFEEWHSALEMKRYVQRFIHHIGGLPDFSALKFTRYNQYESLTLPLVAYLKDHGVRIEHNARVTNVEFEIAAQRKVARRIRLLRDGVAETIDLTHNDLVFVTNGSLVENSSWGDHHTAPRFDTSLPEGNAWTLWRNIAKQDPAFGRPDTFCTTPELTQWESATVTTLDARIPAYLERIARRDPFSGRVVTGGIVTVKDSPWLMSWTINRQPHFTQQPDEQLAIWVYGLFTDRPGSYIKKPMRECTGEEITAEWLYHLGVPVADIPELAAHGAITRPCMMPYVTAFFMPRKKSDRPAVVPEGCVNFAFLGQFTETERDCIFTTEYSVRTAMEAVYQLLDIERGVPEVFASIYDVRCLLDATAKMRDGNKLHLPGALRKRLDRTVVGELLERYHLV